MMDPGQQFQQTSLFPEPRRPVQAHASATRSSTPPVSEPSQQDRLARGEHPVNVFHGGTYPLMMTGGEVRDQFQALDGDRYEKDRTGSTGSTAASGWTGLLGSRHPSDPPEPRKRVANGSESDADLYERKYDEASQKPGKYGSSHGAGLLDKIAEHGYDTKSPISLADGSESGGRGSGARGDYGKFQVLGGHHRIAVMSTGHPKELLSVQWHNNQSSAQSAPGY